MRQAYLNAEYCTEVWSRYTRTYKSSDRAIAPVTSRYNPQTKLNGNVRILAAELSKTDSELPIRFGSQNGYWKSTSAFRFGAEVPKRIEQLQLRHENT